MAITKEKNKHLTDDLRLELEAALHKRKSFSQIKRELGIPRSTIKREITNHRVESTEVFYGRGFNPCAHRIGCKATGMCARPDCARLCTFCGKTSNPTEPNTRPYRAKSKSYLSKSKS